MISDDKCDFCSRPIGFYGCPRHGTDCYDPELHPEWEEGSDE